MVTSICMFSTGSLMYTEVHLNKYWRVFQEMFVIVHGGVVAVQTGGPALEGTSLWPMFVFGFALCFVLTQVGKLVTGINL